MSFNIEVQGGKNYLLPTAGKYCPQDIEIAAIGGQTEGMYCWAKSAQKNELPLGYTKVDRLISTGTQVIDTEIVPTGATKIETLVNYTHTGTGYLFGCLNSWVNGAYGLLQLNSRFQYVYGTTGGNLTISRGEDHNIVMSGTGLTVDGVQTNTWSQNSSLGASNSLCLFGRKLNGSTTQETMTGSIGDTRIYQDGSTLSKNLLCCLDADGTPCMYDTVTGESHYNIGTGTFGTGEVEYKSEALGYALSDDLNAYPQDGYGEDGFYYKRLEDNIPWYEAGSYVWSKSDADGNLIAYVVSDNENEFPEDGQGDDGYYYKLQEMGLSAKHANGTGTLSYQNSPTSSNAYATATFTVKGLGFRPQSVCWYCISNQSRDTSGYAISTGNGITTRQTSYSSVYANKAASFTDDGFSVDIVHNQVYNTNNWPVYWWATGL